MDRTRLIDCHVGLFFGEDMLLIFLILIAALIFFKLFREFGKTHKFVMNLSDEDREKLRKTLEEITPGKSEDQSVPPPGKDKNLLKLQEKFPGFSIDSFFDKVEDMFDAIFNAFANSHHHILKSLLSEKLYEDFSEQMKKREQKNLRQELLIKHNQTKVERVQFLTDKARIYVTFDVSQMSAMVDIDGVSFDNPKRLYRDVIHKWAFEREYKKGDWIVSKTSAAEA